MNSIRDRIIARVPSLAGKISGATALSAALSNPGTVAGTPVVYLLEGSLDGGEPHSLGPLTIQGLIRRIDVVLFYNTRDPAGALALDGLGALARAVMDALVGWAELETDAPWLFGSGRWRTFEAGLTSYQLTFTRDDNLRITV